MRTLTIDQSIQLLRNLGQVSDDPALIIFRFLSQFRMLARDSGLPAFDFGDHHQVVLEVPDGLLVIHTDKVPPALVFSHGIVC